jgi:pimeloyl-ACP methyl ester carboxylesterase
MLIEDSPDACSFSDQAAISFDILSRPRLKLRRRVGIILGIICAVVLVAAAAGSIYEQIGQRTDRERLPQIGRSIDIGGRTLNIFCSGEGSPAVILHSGAGEPGFAWSHLQPEIAKVTKACWFDRAGYGWSDPGPFPRTSDAMARELHELLRRADIPAPYVLVGHSLGGLNARVFNGLYPRDVAGAVLVDAAHEDEPRRAPDFMLGRTAPRLLWRPIWIAAQTARLTGVIRLMAPQIDLPDDRSQRTREQIVTALRQQPKTIATLADATTPDSYAQAEAAGGFGDRPLVVLTRGNSVLPSNPNEMDRQRADYEQAWMHEIQPKLARLSTRGRQVIVARSGHGIPDEAPEEVVAAIRNVLASVRGEARRSLGAAPR